jgi:hypothetical protein
LKTNPTVNSKKRLRHYPFSSVNKRLSKLDIDGIIQKIIQTDVFKDGFACRRQNNRWSHMTIQGFLPA